MNNSSHTDKFLDLTLKFSLVYSGSGFDLGFGFGITLMFNKKKSYKKTFADFSTGLFLAL